MILNTDKYQQNEILKFMREATNLSQQEFAKSIGKSKDWVRKNEYGLTNYYFKDLLYNTPPESQLEIYLFYIIFIENKN